MCGSKKIGDFEATIATDGGLPLGDPHKNYIGLSPEETQAAVAEFPADRQYRPRADCSDCEYRRQADPVRHRARQPAPVWADDRKAAVEPEGCGDRSQGYRCRGDDPCPCRPPRRQHQDDGTSNFPNEQFYITQADFDFWTHESKPKGMKTFIDTARRNLIPNKDRLHFIKGWLRSPAGRPCDSGAGAHGRAHDLHGQLGQGSLCYVGDLAHHPILLLEKPLTEFAYDTDPKMSAKSRVKMLTMLADNKTRMLA